MKPTQQLHDLGQSLWLDNITRGFLTNGTLRYYLRSRTMAQWVSPWPLMEAMPTR